MVRAGTHCFMFCWKKIEVHNGFIRSVIWHQSATSEGALIVLDCLAMAYPEHFDWLKETVRFLPGRSSALMSLRVGWNENVRVQRWDITCCSGPIIPGLLTWFEWGMLQTSHCVVNTANAKKHLLQQKLFTAVQIHLLGMEGEMHAYVNSFWAQLNHPKERGLERTSECK